jgi:hypothetical protein
MLQFVPIVEAFRGGLRQELRFRIGTPRSSSDLALPPW